MSKPWKIILAVGVVIIVIGLCLGGLVGLGFNRMQNFAAINRATLEKPFPPGSGRFSQFEGRGRFDQDPSGQARQLEVRLIDDDDDGIPDRGVVDLPAGRRGGPGDRFDARPGRGFAPDARPGRFPDTRFGPFLLLAGLLRLAVLGAVIVSAVVLGLALYHRWRPASSTPTAPGATVPPPVAPESPEVEAVTEEDEPEAGEPEEETAAADDATPETVEPGAPDDEAPAAVSAGEDLEDEPSPGAGASTPRT